MVSSPLVVIDSNPFSPSSEVSSSEEVPKRGRIKDARSSAPVAGTPVAEVAASSHPTQVSRGSVEQEVRAPTQRTQSTPLCLEFCCGSAGITKAMPSVGFRSVGFDYSFNRSKPEGFALDVDLCTAEGQELAMQWLRHPALVFVWRAPPCGTASRAREKPGGPPPLRTDDEPHGR